jgi:hypothetical protein
VRELDDLVVQTVERHSGATTGVRNGDPTSLVGYERAASSIGTARR